MAHDDNTRITGKSIIRQWEILKANRGTFETHWQEVADLVTPTRDFTVTRSPGEKRRNRIFDSTATFAADRLAGALNGLLVNPSLAWFTLVTQDDQVNKQDDVRQWLQNASKKMLHLFNTPRFGFYSAVNEVFQDLVSFGTGCMFTQTPPGDMRFQPIALGSAFIDESHTGIVDTVYREFSWTASQIVTAFDKKAPDKVKQAVIDGKPDQKFTLVQAVLPRRARDPFRKTNLNKPWASFIVSVEEKEIIAESGFDEFPFVAPRWSKVAGEMYGRSPAMTMLPEIKMVNTMARTMIVAAEKVADPPFMVPDDGFIGPLRTQPGGLTYYRSGTRDRAEPLITGARPDLNENIIEQRRGLIKQGFYLDMFQLPMLDRMTATEVQQRQREQMQQLSPSLTRLYSEMIGPLIDRVFNLLIREDVFGEIPEALSDQSLTIEYLSPLAQSQRSSESSGFFQFMQMIGPIAQMNPDILRNLDGDEIVHWSKGMYNLPQEIFRGREEVEEERQQEQQAAAAQQGAETAATAAGAAKDASAAGIPIAEALSSGV